MPRSLWVNTRSDDSGADPEKGSGLSAEPRSWGDYSQATYERPQSGQKQTKEKTRNQEQRTLGGTGRQTRQCRRELVL